jgi:hypothetical protein
MFSQIPSSLSDARFGLHRSRVGLFHLRFGFFPSSLREERPHSRSTPTKPQSPSEDEGSQEEAGKGGQRPSEAVHDAGELLLHLGKPSFHVGNSSGKWLVAFFTQPVRGRRATQQGRSTPQRIESAAGLRTNNIKAGRLRSVVIRGSRAAAGSESTLRGHIRKAEVGLVM